MKQYIDKDALVAKIKTLENIYKICSTRNSYEKGLKNGRLIGYKDALHEIETLEVKDVDLDSTLSNLDENIKEFITTEEFENESALSGRYWAIAKHAFLLGLKARKNV